VVNFYFGVDTSRGGPSNLSLVLQLPYQSPSFCSQRNCCISSRRTNASAVKRIAIRALRNLVGALGGGR
jgi:hypothetical protein